MINQIVLPFSLLECAICVNIPSKKFYSAFGTKLLGRARTTSTCNELMTSSKALLNKNQSQDGNAVFLKRILSIYFG